MDIDNVLVFSYSYPLINMTSQLITTIHFQGPYAPRITPRADESIALQNKYVRIYYRNSMNYIK